MNRRGYVAVCLFFGFFAFIACHNPEVSSSRASAQLSGYDSQRSRLRAWVDPETGLLGAPAEEQLTHDGGGAAVVDSDDLVLVPGKTSAGGMMVDLRGRFAYSRRASVSPDGRVATRCDLRDEVDGSD
jgi:hypothetical protein